MPGGIAANSGKLRMGDRILQVNGIDVTAATHQEAVMELLRQSDDIKLFVQHDPLPVGFQVRCVAMLSLKQPDQLLSKDDCAHQIACLLSLKYFVQFITPTNLKLQ